MFVIAIEIKRKYIFFKKKGEEKVRKEA